MNTPALQRTDRWIGVPLCAVLSGLRRLGGRRHPAAGPVRRLLLVKLAEQGSTVLAYPALREAVAQVGRDNLFVLLFESSRPIMDVVGLVAPENVITISIASWPALVRTAAAAVRRLRRLHLDAAVDMDFFSRGSAALAYASGARRRVGFHAFFGAGPYRGDLFTHRLIYNPHLHTTDTFLALVRAVMEKPETLPTFETVVRTTEDDPPLFRPTSDEVMAAERLVHGDGPGRAPLILLNPNASDLIPLRRWPTASYVALARRLLARFPDLIVGITGSREETAAAATFVREVGSERCRSLAGKTNLRELLAVYSLAEVLVTNDSGPAHFAMLTPVQVVTLFGPETPRLFAARTARNTVLWAGLACSPCVSAYNSRVSPCRDNRCMQAITVEAVFEAVCAARERHARQRTIDQMSP